MLANYLRIALRNLWKNRFYAGINIIGLAAGITCFLLILVFVQHESSYDRFHSAADRIYRVGFEGKMGESDLDIPQVGSPAGAQMMAEFPEIEAYTRMRDHGYYLVRKDDQSYREDGIIFADSTFFDVFSFELLSGSKEEILRAPETAVISASMAHKYFGEEDPIGQSLRLDDEQDIVITGIMSDMPNNSHFRRDMLVSLSTLEESRDGQWTSMNFHTYLLLREGTSIAGIEQQLPDFMRRHVGGELEKFLHITFDDFLAAGNYAEFTLMPLTDIYLHSNSNDELAQRGDIKYLYIFGCIGLFILLLACINFINLATARAVTRAREVGVRKVVGAQRSQLIAQFLSESTLLAGFSVAVALFFLALALPFFNQLTGKELVLSQLLHQPWLWASVLGLMLFVGLLAGLYPAFHLTSFRPIQVMKSTKPAGQGPSRSSLRSGLVVFQFAITALLLSATFVVYQQMNYIQEKKLGFNKEQLLLLNGAYGLGDQLDAFVQEMERDPRVSSAVATSYLPIPSSRNSRAYFEGRSTESENSHVCQAWYVGQNYLPTMGMNLTEGRNFHEGSARDSTAIIVNEAAVKAFGFDDPIGKEINTLFGGDSGPDGQPLPVVYTIVGVVEDFHFESLRQRIDPLIMHLGDSRSFVALRAATDDIAGLLATAESRWQAMAPGLPFQHSFLDEGFSQVYEAELRTSRIAGLFTGLAILIACIGLLGLSTFTAAQRRKEISIRKVLGASTPGLFLLLVRDFSKLVVLAFVISIPLTWYLMRQWLQGFEYATSIGPLVFIVTALALFGIAALAITYQSLRVAHSNPVNALRSE